MNIPTSLSPTKALAFAAALPDPEERRKLFEHFCQRPWNEENRTKALLGSLDISIEQPQPATPPQISSNSESGLDHFVVDNTSPSTKLQDFPSQKPNPNQKPRYYRYHPPKNYTLAEAFDDPDNKSPILPPFWALQASVNAAKPKPAPLPKADLAKTDPTPNVDKKGSSRLFDYKIHIPAAQSPIAKSKKPR